MKKLSLKLGILIFLICFTFIFAAYAEEQSASPYNINITVYQEDKGAYGITWFALEEYQDPVIEVILEDSSLFFTASVSKRSDHYIYKGVTKDLEPSVTYYYRVGDRATGVFSEKYYFTTSSEDNSKFTFFHMTDSQLGYSQWATVLAEAFDLYDASLVVHTGDLVDWGPDEFEWQTAFEYTKEHLRNVLISSVAGSYHESQGYELYEHFNFNVPEGQFHYGGLYYSYDYNNVHFTMLDINDYSNGKLGEEQIKWLIKDLKSTDKEWKILGLHWSMYSSGVRFTYEEIINIRTQLSPILDEYNVDLVLSGHDHVYTRTYPIHDGKAILESKTKTETFNGTETVFTVDPEGTVFLVSNTVGNKFYDETVTEESLQFFVKHGQPYLPMFSAITVDGNKLVINVYTVDPRTGETVPYDSYAIMKTSSAENRSNAIVIILLIVVILVILVLLTAFLITKRKGRLGGAKVFKQNF